MKQTPGAFIECESLVGEGYFGKDLNLFPTIVSIMGVGGETNLGFP